MKVLLLWARPDQPNMGVRVLYHGSKQLLKRAFPNESLEVQFAGTGTNSDSPLNINHTTPLLQEWVRPRVGFRDWLESFDLLFDIGGGDSFTDIYGTKRLLKKQLINELAHRAKVPLVLGPQTIGPFQTKAGHLVARRVLSTARCVMVRDPQSVAAASSLGRAPDVQTTDVVFTLPRHRVEKRYDIVLNVSGLLWFDNPHVDSAKYRALISRLLKEAQSSGRQVTLLSHVEGAGGSTLDSDVAAARSLNGTLAAPLEHLVPQTLDEAREYLGAANIVFGARMHACLNALTMGTPAIPMAYSRKFAPLLGDIGWNETVDLSARGASEAISGALHSPPSNEAIAASLQRADELVERGVKTLRSSFFGERS